MDSDTALTSPTPVHRKGAVPTLLQRLNFASPWLSASSMIVVLWTLLILPAAFLNGLFPLDLGGILDICTHLQQRLHWILSPYNGSGRYVPVYWLYHVLLFRLFSTQTQAFYLIQHSIFLSSLLIVLGRLFERIAFRRIVTIFFCITLFVSSPNPETLFTLGKPEPLILFFISIVLLLFYGSRADGARPQSSCDTSQYHCYSLYLSGPKRHHWPSLRSVLAD